MNEPFDLKEIQGSIQSFLDTFNEYSDEIFGERRRNRLDDLRAKLQRQQPIITKHLIDMLGAQSFRLGSFGVSQILSLQELLPTALMGGNNEETFNFDDYKPPVTSVLTRALGMIESGLWPPKKRKPILIIRDEELKNRCSDLLSAPGAYDRVIREATTVLEDRIRNKPSHETLSRLIPNSADQSGEKLVNKLFNPDNPILVISSEKDKRVAFYKVLVGIFSYLRNPYHHHIDSTTEWSWAWSSVGFIDNLLDAIDNCTINQ